jgi:hypothetical protein
MISIVVLHLVRLTSTRTVLESVAAGAGWMVWSVDAANKPEHFREPIMSGFRPHEHHDLNHPSAAVLQDATA